MASARGQIYRASISGRSQHQMSDWATLQDHKSPLQPKSDNNDEEIEERIERAVQTRLERIQGFKSTSVSCKTMGCAGFADSLASKHDPVSLFCLTCLRTKRVSLRSESIQEVEEEENAYYRQIGKKR